MPAEVGYGPSVNLAAEASRPPTLPTKVTQSVTETSDRQPVRVEDEQETGSNVAESEAGSGNTTADRGQNVNITA